MKDKQVATFYRQFATMVDAGMPIGRSLKTLANQHRGSSRALVMRLHAAVDSGERLSEAMVHEPRIFPPLQVNLIRAGETSGQLDQVMNRIAEGLELNAKLRGELITRLLYPAIVLHVAILIRAVVAMFLQGTGPAILSLVTGFGTLYAVALVIQILRVIANRVPPLGAIRDQLCLTIPVIRGITKNLALGRFARTLEALYTAGFSMPQAIEMAADAVGNIPTTRRLKRAIPIVKDGMGVTAALTATGVFDTMTLGMIQTGEESGRLDGMLRKVAEHAESSAQVAIERLGKILPLFIYILIMIYVGSMILSIMGTYIGQINDAFNG